MKKIASKIAIILIILMIASSFTSCFTTWAFESGTDWGLGGIFVIPVVLMLDAATFPIQLTIFIVELAIYTESMQKAMRMDNIDTFSFSAAPAVNDEIYLLAEKFNSLPETEIAAFTNTVNSFSEIEILAVIEAFNKLSEEEIISSIETINSMSDETLIAAMNSLQYIEFHHN